VSSGFLGEREDYYEDREEHMCASDFEAEIEEEEAMCAGANVGRSYSYLCPVFMRDAK